jgi:hypothetical protein
LRKIIQADGVTVIQVLSQDKVRKSLMWLESLMRTKVADIEIGVIQVEELGPDYMFLKD